MYCVLPAYSTIHKLVYLGRFTACFLLLCPNWTTTKFQYLLQVPLDRCDMVLLRFTVFQAPDEVYITTMQQIRRMGIFATVWCSWTSMTAWNCILAEGISFLKVWGYFWVLKKLSFPKVHEVYHNTITTCSKFCSNSDCTSPFCQDVC